MMWVEGEPGEVLDMVEEEKHVAYVGRELAIDP
jgi:hypothetical protein